MDQTVIIAIVAVVAVAAALVAWLVFGRRRHVEIAAPSLDAAPPAPTLARATASDDLEARLAAFDPPSPAVEPVRDPDNLMHLKGVGPRLAKTLYDMGIGKFAQIAAWTDADIDRIEPRLGGHFAGRIRGDRWIDQARLLAAGDIAGYEAEFGKVGAIRPLIARALIAGAGAALAAAALAQSLDEQRADLARAQAVGREASERARRLEAAADAANDAAGRARAAAAAVAARIQSAEADIDAAQARIAVIEQLRAEQRARLALKQGPTVRLVAALQTMARRPPALSLLQPGSMSDIVHTHAVLAGVIPIVRARTAELRADVERGRQLRLAADAALGARKAAQGDLVAQRQRLATLEARKRVESAQYTSSAMTEQDRAIAMGEQARDIGELMSRIDDAASVLSRLETLPGPTLRPAMPGAPRALPVETAAAPAASPAYRLPVVGRVVTGLGEVSDTGVKARGLTIATRPDAQVVAPATGRIAFAGPFRGYGSIVVIDHGLGWTTVVTSLAAIDVRVGDTVDQGSPIGRAGNQRPTVTVELRRRGTPVDIARLAG